jgi:hypothetical protein
MPTRRRLTKRAALPLPGRRFLTRPRLVGAGITLTALLLVYIASAVHTANSYVQRLGSATFSFMGQLQFEGQDFLSPMDSDMAFSGSFSRAGQFAASTRFLGTWAGRDYAGDARITSGRLYFNLSGASMPVIRYRQGSYLLSLESGRWYTAGLDESIYDSVCAHNEPSTLQGKLQLYRAVKNLRLTPSPWVNFFASRGGHPAVHLSGTLSGTQLASLLQALQAAAPPGCGSINTLGLSAEDLKHVATRLDLYANTSHDQLVVTLSDKTLGAKATLTLDTYNYNQPVSIPKPTGATDLGALYSAARVR